ncbi:MAG TPA: hypothetical protein VJ436_00185 [Anaerolineales bacterium]|nr:hypothetical protein [Anaerolineales bacterium]
MAGPAYRCALRPGWGRAGQVRRPGSPPGLIPDEAHLIYLLDVYGVPWSAYFSVRLDDPDLHSDILSWLAFIGIQCPE